MGNCSPPEKSSVTAASQTAITQSNSNSALQAVKGKFSNFQLSKKTKFGKMIFRTRYPSESWVLNVGVNQMYGNTLGKKIKECELTEAEVSVPTRELRGVFGFSNTRFRLADDVSTCLVLKYFWLTLRF